MKKKNILPFYFSIIALFLLISNTVMGASKSQSEITNNSLQQYFFEMDKNKQEEFFKKLYLVKIGDSIQIVKNILGEPTYDQKLVSKEGVFRARILKYYIKILEKGLVNEKYDKAVRLIFNAKDTLIEIELQNIEGFQYRK